MWSKIQALNTVEALERHSEQALLNLALQCQYRILQGSHVVVIPLKVNWVPGKSNMNESLK